MQFSHRCSIKLCAVHPFTSYSALEHAALADDPTCSPPRALLQHCARCWLAAPSTALAPFPHQRRHDSLRDCLPSEAFIPSL